MASIGSGPHHLGVIVRRRRRMQCFDAGFARSRAPRPRVSPSRYKANSARGGPYGRHRRCSRNRLRVDSSDARMSGGVRRMAGPWPGLRLGRAKETWEARASGSRVREQARCRRPLGFGSLSERRERPGTTGHASRDQPEEAHAAACLRLRAAIRRPVAAADAVSFSHGGTEARRRTGRETRDERRQDETRQDETRGAGGRTGVTGEGTVRPEREEERARARRENGARHVPGTVSQPPSRFEEARSPCLRERPRARQPHAAARVPTGLHPHEILKTWKSLLQKGGASADRAPRVV